MNKLESRKYRINLEGFITPKNHDEFVELLKIATKENYKMVSKFSMMNGYGRFLHKKCDKTFRTTPYKLLIEGEGCPYCKDKIDISHILYNNKYEEYIKQSEFTKRVYDKYYTEYIVLDMYESDTKPLNIIHTKCGEIIKRQPKKILETNIRCPICEPRNKWDIKKVKTTIKNMTDSEFIVVADEYKDIDTPLEIKHNVCGNTFFDSPNAFMKTPKCKICENNISLHEKWIRDYFIKNKIQYEREYSIEGCRNLQLLKFDFAIFKNDKLICLMEYDGQQHFYPVFDEESFIRTRIADQTKNKFCEENNITFIRIPFWEVDNDINKLRKILNNKMKELKLTK